MQWRRWAVYVGSFGLGRGALFGAPLLLANLLPLSDYGNLETAQAAASLASGIATLGTASVIPLVLLGRNDRTTLQAIVSHHLLLAVSCLAIASLTFACGLSSAVSLAALLTSAVALQALGSTHLRTLGRGDASVLLDAGLFGLMALAAVGARLSRSTHPISWVVTSAAGYVVAIAIVYLKLLSDRGTASRAFALCTGKHWQSAILAGIPLMLGGVVSLLATTSGRLGMGVLAGPVATADYAVLARAGALPIVAHQLFMIASYRNLFADDDASVNRVALRIVGLVAASALAFCILSPWLGFVLGPTFVGAMRHYRLPGLWIVSQSVLWSAIALNDLVISRHQLMARILPATATFIAILLAAGWIVLHIVGPSISHFVLVHSALMLLFYSVQAGAMRANGIRMWRVWSTAAVSYCALLFFSFLIASSTPTLS